MNCYRCKKSLTKKQITNGQKFCSRKCYWLARVGSNPNIHQQKRVGGKLFYTHRLVWEAKRGKIPDGFVVHHIDGNKANNKLSNLALMSISAHIALHNEFKGNNNHTYGDFDKDLGF